VRAEPDRYELHHQDETHLETNPHLCRVWHRKGQQATVPAAGTNRRVTAFGSVEAFGRGRVEIVCAGQDSACFLLYLEALDARHEATGREVFLVLDNGPAHTSKVSRAALAARAAWLHVIWLARYSPHLNEKEREWRYLKRDVRSHLARGLRAFVDEILAGLRALGGERLDIADHVPAWWLAGHRKEPAGGEGHQAAQAARHELTSTYLVVHPLSGADISAEGDAGLTPRAVPPPAAPDEGVLVGIPVRGRLHNGGANLRPGLEAAAFEGERAEDLPPGLDEVEVRGVCRLEDEFPARVRQREEQHVGGAMGAEVVEHGVDARHVGGRAALDLL
jgi:transposase